MNWANRWRAYREEQERLWRDRDMNMIEERKMRFEAERLEAMRSIERTDWPEARKILIAYFRDNGAAVPPSDLALISAYHHERLRTTGLTEAEYAASRAWLRDH